MKAFRTIMMKVKILICINNGVEEKYEIWKGIKYKMILGIQLILILVEDLHLLGNLYQKMTIKVWNKDLKIMKFIQIIKIDWNSD